MGADRHGFDHRTVFERQGIGQPDEPILRDDEVVLCGAVGLEGLYAQMLADVILPAAAGSACPADQLRTGRHLVAGFARDDLCADGGDDSRILMSLNDGVERSGVLPVIGVDLTAADADLVDADENIMFSQLCGSKVRNLAESIRSGAVSTACLISFEY